MSRVVQYVLFGVMGVAFVGLVGLVLAGSLSKKRKEATTAWGYVDHNGAMVIQPRFLEAGPFRDGAAPVRTADGWGYVKPDGTWLREPGLRKAAPFSEGLAAAVDDQDLTGWIGTDGTWAIPPSFHRGDSFSQGRARAAKAVGRTTNRVSSDMSDIIYSWGWIDTQGQWVLEPTERDDPLRITDAHAFSEDRAGFERGGAYGFVDLQGQVVVPPRFQAISAFRQGLAPVKLDDRWGYVDPQGQVVVQPTYAAATQFVDGLARVRMDKSSYIRPDGERASAEVWEDARAFAQQRGAVQVDGAWGFVDAEGQVVIAPAFADVGQAGFAEGLCPVAVREGGKKVWGFVDLQGAPAFQQSFLEIGTAGFSEGLAAVRVDKL